MSVYVMTFRVEPENGPTFWLMKIGKTGKPIHERMWSLLNSVVFSGMACTAWRLEWNFESEHDDAVEERSLAMAAELVTADMLDRLPTRREWFKLRDTRLHYPDLSAVGLVDPSCWVDYETGEFLPDGPPEEE